MDEADDFAENRQFKTQGQAQSIRSSMIWVMTQIMLASVHQELN